MSNNAYQLRKIFYKNAEKATFDSICHVTDRRIFNKKEMMFDEDNYENIFDKPDNSSFSSEIYWSFVVFRKSEKDNNDSLTDMANIIRLCVKKDDPDKELYIEYHSRAMGDQTNVLDLRRSIINIIDRYIKHLPTHTEE